MLGAFHPQHNSTFAIVLKPNIYAPVSQSECWSVKSRYLDEHCVGLGSGYQRFFVPQQQFVILHWAPAVVKLTLVGQMREGEGKLMGQQSADHPNDGKDKNSEFIFIFYVAIVYLV